jgi:bacterial/archaeal transporter family-2 protein
VEIGYVRFLASPGHACWSECSHAGRAQCDTRSDLASWSWAALTSYAVGTVAMLIVILVQRAPLPSFTLAAAVPWWGWAGGCLGAAYVVLSIVLLQRLGASTVAAFVVAGQMLGALAFDQFALMGLDRLPATPLRLAGTLLLVGGVILMRL